MTDIPFHWHKDERPAARFLTMMISNVANTATHRPTSPSRPSTVYSVTFTSTVDASNSNNNAIIIIMIVMMMIIIIMIIIIHFDYLSSLRNI